MIGRPDYANGDRLAATPVRIEAAVLRFGDSRASHCFFRGKSIKTTSEFWRSRSKTMCAPPGVMSKVSIVAGLSRCASCLVFMVVQSSSQKYWGRKRSWHIHERLPIRHESKPLAFTPQLDWRKLHSQTRTSC